MKETKTAIRDAIDGLDVLAYEQNKLCVPKSICATKLSFHPVIPGREKYLTEEARDALAEFTPQYTVRRMFMFHFITKNFAKSNFAKIRTHLLSLGLQDLQQ